MLHHSLEPSQVVYRTEELLAAASNRFRVTVQVASRAKKRAYEVLKGADPKEDTTYKTVIWAILEMADEVTQPEIIGD